jgi:hypothetical protein
MLHHHGAHERHRVGLRQARLSVDLGSSADLQRDIEPAVAEMSSRDANESGPGESDSRRAAGVVVFGRQESRAGHPGADTREKHLTSSGDRTASD